MNEPRSGEAALMSAALDNKCAPNNRSALAFKRSGDPGMGNFDDATILQSFGQVPKNLDEL